jgi:asparagine synthetase B (glutamine-hydrolysing)
MKPNTEVKLPGIEISLSKEPYVKLKCNETDNTILQEIGKVLQDKQDVNIALSGGLDSQFMLQCCLQLDKNITLYTYRSFWGDVIVNSEDLYFAEMIAKRHNLKHYIIDIDLKPFFTTFQHYKYGKDFFNTSPQLAVHFHFLKLIKKEYDIQHILMGGDLPIFKYAKVNDKEKLFLSGESVYQDIMAPYYLFCDSIDVECVKDIFYHSEELVYLGFENNLNLLKNRKVYCLGPDNSHPDHVPYKESHYKYKEMLYKNIFEDLNIQSFQTNGFETLKKLLASETGVYNQFDILYREPLNDLVPEFIPNRIRSKRNLSYDPIIKFLYKDFLNFIEENKCENINRYRFDF